MLTVSSAVEPGATLRARLTGFAGFLHANGFDTGGADSVRVLETAVHTGILDRQILHWSLKALLCGRGDEWRRFDALFDAYFLPPNRKIFVASNVVAAGARESHGATGDGSESEPAAGTGHGVVGDTDTGAARHGASREESLASTDFSELNRAELRRRVISREVVLNPAKMLVRLRQPRTMDACRWRTITHVSLSLVRQQNRRRSWRKRLRRRLFTTCLSLVRGSSNSNLP